MRDTIEVGFKLCNTCGKVKELCKFSTNNSNKDNKCSKCKDCANKYEKVWRKNKMITDKGYFHNKYLKAKGTEKLINRRRKASKNYQKNNPELHNCRARTIFAIKMGKLIRPNNCSKCNIECKPEAHHPDYENHLYVKWLCKQCHVNFHKELLNENKY